ncbi:hypothetical protein VPNG_09305 [Cytospora leucostoma]|uniref:Cyanovirin-N domain-containing protein n=1 Tax=Cytospora leucostoma TaxID=1230097 RepID=A0A423VUS3_9PEZI|nr:hypothetical protein VPNG_09305 [Cytospora leucostoma]
MANFHRTADIPSIRIDDAHILRARVTRNDGEHVDAEIDLNRYIGNIDGHFQWGGQNYSETAQNVRFHIEGENQPILRASLRQINGEWADRDINLTERILNHDGRLEFEP